MQIRKKFRKWREVAGPGVVTGASDDDPSGILIYLQSGVVLGFQALWTALLTLPLMYALQEMCGRLGLVTGKGLIRLIKEEYSRWVLYPIAIVSVVAITVNIGANLLAIGTVFERLTGWSRLAWIPLSAFFILYCTLFFSYRRFSRVLMWLAFSLFFYIATALSLNIDWARALQHTFWPSMTWSPQNILLVAAILGTTISPYLFFWQANEEVEERAAIKRFTVTKHELKFLAKDTFLGMLFSNVTMWFIILAASQLNESYHLPMLLTFDQAALILQPLLGDWAFLAFSAGIIGTGFLAIPVLAGSIGYAFAEIFGWEEGVDRTFREAKGFYLAICGATVVGTLLVFFGADPLALLVYTGVLYTLITPPLIFIVIRLASDPRIVGRNVSSKIEVGFGWLALSLMSAAGVGFLTTLF